MLPGRFRPTSYSWQTLIELLCQLPRLRTLELKNFLLEPLGPVFDTDPLCTAPVIEHLEALKFTRHCRTQDGIGCFGDVLHLLSIFKRIDHLDFGAFTSPPTGHPSLASRITTQVRSLTIPPYASRLLRSIPLLATWSNLECLALPLLPLEDVAYGLRLLNLARASLRHVALHVPRIDEKGPTVRCLHELALATCPRLESVSIAVPFYGAANLLVAPGAVAIGRPYFGASAYAFITGFLASCPPALRRVTFDLQLDLTPVETHQHIQLEMLQTDWSTLDDVLARCANRGLTSVQFCHDPRELSELSSSIQQYFAKRMPCLWRTDVARFV
ncbi:uncharacterized protein PHACADRAFT_250783 [Phanerochaete carnosa HHB-10118-sp]|uniref:F-box domain-containing protein n=1 Tax=Phanerochaete carnosa (strain HHB-10118-sp) TaxID=650164 RepID=K5XAK6_PHACS|nr:uncharacterized protein PHACADRAFT_250783 [Phanerochaete carnosa HHB-10118-sp]EKM59962.1 hypothetical protein PHACADRAFT_250783 [Phanerochaete carnosa HHB-10118-sp]